MTNEATGLRSARRGEAQFTGDEQLIWDAICVMYDHYLNADRPAADSFIHDDCTMWDSENPRLHRGLAALNEIRNARPEGGGPEGVSELAAVLPVIDVWGDVAVAKHILIVEFVDGSPTEQIRNTGVWRRVDGRWMMFHNHEDVLPASTPSLENS